MKLKNRKSGIMLGMILGIVILLSTVSVASAASITSDGNWEYRIITTTDNSYVIIDEYRGVDRNVTFRRR